MVHRGVSECLGAWPLPIGAASDRHGIRLSGSPLNRRTDPELLSEPAIRGAVEVPPDGLPMVFSADHPTTCGYPVIVVLEPDATRPGSPVQARRVDHLRLDQAPNPPMRPRGGSDQR
jgi:allophanate hydrolase subunit 2